MSSADGASPRPPEGRNNLPDPSWTPKEPNRPLLPKPGAFGASKTFPVESKWCNDPDSPTPDPAPDTTPPEVTPW